ncbi:LuxQ periplasmic sensor domain-containing protein [Aliivibrio fischeri]|uniref:LuxQ periplasmic sensor domain-containing protein n=1 Tax=Aliivibrio fischeri TaxID=668 RepID=UPI0007C4650F|nr:LuxQ periplasmic sensor domain-containing protein [Aliivibrio fischeri]
MNKGKASLADLIFRSIFIIFSILTVGITIHTYQLSVNTINEEVKRNLQQTSGIINNFFEHRLSILQIRQDTDAESLAIYDQYIEIDYKNKLNTYFSNIEAKSPYNSPDFRFIEVNNKLYWDDGNSSFLSLNENCLKIIIKKNLNINTWYYIKMKEPLSEADFLIRKTPIVNNDSGRIVAFIYNAVMLNNNISFLNKLKKLTNSQDVFIINDNKILASSVSSNTEIYQEVTSILNGTRKRIPSKILNFTPINIKSMSGEISILSLKNKDNIELLEQRFIYSVVLSFFVLIAIAVLIRGLFEHKILLSLNSLLKYTNTVSKNETRSEYQGCGILEFDQIGEKLEQTFSELIEAKEDSYKAQRAAEKLAQVKSDFLARMSHEIRTPLNGILGISSLLKSSNLTREQQKQVNILHQGGEHLLAVLNDILDFSQIEQEKLKINSAPFKLSDVLENINAIYFPLCKNKNVLFSIENHVNPDVFINSDQVRLTQILFNLLSNAVKFTEKGKVKLTLSLNKHNSDYYLQFSVDDTGVGICAEEQARMFEPFEQSGFSESRKFGGSGLGLAIVKQLLDLLKGKITINSTLGVGSTFSVLIPVLICEDKADISDVKAENQITSLPTGLKILLIEDNKSNAYIAKAYCQKYGLNVTWRNDAAQGIAELSKSEFDLILMDNQMPGMSGIKATKYIRNHLKIMTPIYAYTADALEESNQEFFSAGANYIITKPIKEKSILDALAFYKSENGLPPFDS